MPAGSQRKRVAVLGGGPAAIAAAFELTSPELEGAYEVTVYQPGWRLGGKCASGRNLEERRGNRIEEHGLHIWFGFYENAFSIMRRAYEELDRPPGHPLQTMEDAFKGCDEIVLYDRQGEEWRALELKALPNDQKPGEQHELPGFWEISRWMCDWALRELRRHDATSGTLAGQAQRTLQEPLSRERAQTLAQRVRAHLLRGLRLAAPTQPLDGEQAEPVHELSGGELLGAAAKLARHGHDRECERHRHHIPLLAGVLNSCEVGLEQLLAKLLAGFRDCLWELAHEQIERDVDLRLFFTIFDTFASAVCGIVDDGVLGAEGWEAINRFELCEWLRDHGAKQVTLGATPAERSPLLRAIYDVAFGYLDGDIASANVAAGAAVSDLLRLAFTYRGSIMYKMQAGMGDTVLSPLYEVLKARGVKFELFNAVTGLGLSEDASAVARIEVVEQLRLREEGYDPIVEVEGLSCWPSEPLWQQIPDGDALRARQPDFEGEANPLGREPRTLELGRDFDDVVLGIPVGALGPICGELAARHERFAQMLDASATVATQAFQLWLTKSPQQLGCCYPENSVAGCYVEPLDTWCDMTHLLARESWAPEDGVAGIAYFCGVLRERADETPQQATARVQAGAREFFERDLATLWPGMSGRVGGVRWDVLADPGAEGADGDERMAAQYFRANVSPSERYVLTPAGTVAKRLRAGESGVGNLFLAGDWTRNGIDGGCVEAAMLSGAQAARALTGALERELVGESPTWLGADDRGEVSLPAAPAEAGARGSRPPYVEYGGRATAPPPFLSTEGSFHGYLLRGDEQLIAALIDRVLNVPAAGEVHYKPLFGPWLLMLTGAFAKVSSQFPGFERWGHVDEAQTSIWVPLGAGHLDGELFEMERICMAVPYILVNNPMSYAGGREDYGYPKSLGIFDPPQALGERVTVQAFGGNFAAGNAAGWHRLLEIARGRVAAPGGSAAGEWHDPLRVLEHLREHAAAHAIDLPEPGFLGDVFDVLSGTQARQVFLKQFRDVSASDTACYQAVVEAPIRFLSTELRLSPHEWSVVVDPLDSHPIGCELGLLTQRTLLTFEVRMDFIAEAGEVVAPAPHAAAGLNGSSTARSDPCGAAQAQPGTG